MNKQTKTLNILIHFYLDVLFSPNLALGQFNLVLYEELWKVRKFHEQQVKVFNRLSRAGDKEGIEVIQLPNTGESWALGSSLLS